ncbi:predicted protein [Streptomyces viridosporus ATCC 14672]|uniref:Predicted protein n=1 Tax=Streptomyces viridosporus (strain ATCC 14672 / DSM 40746 / JCM 4963 / KCTC 9882 / NRRL B-12104 / FH 1290) TaxID=566461 RepID=D6A587_STRV1|nr:predicted protein [Streptomyces viridosporus ATCC 14672]
MSRPARCSAHRRTWSGPRPPLRFPCHLQRTCVGRAPRAHVRSARDVLTTGAAPVPRSPPGVCHRADNTPDPHLSPGRQGGVLRLRRVWIRGTPPTDPRPEREGEAGKHPSWLRPAGATDPEPSTTPARYDRVTSAGNTGIRVFRDTDFSHPEPVRAQIKHTSDIVTG